MLITILKEREADFDKELVFSNNVVIPDANQIKSHNRATLLAVVEGLGKILEEKKMTMRAANMTGSHAGFGYTQGNNSVISDIQSILNEFKKEINESK